MTSTKGVKRNGGTTAGRKTAQGTRGTTTGLGAVHDDCKRAGGGHGSDNARAVRGEGVRRLQRARVHQGTGEPRQYATFLKCDYDGRIPANVIAVRLVMLARLHRLRVRFVRFDRTRNGYHMVVALDNSAVSFARVILLQALLGSDWKREAYNSARALRMRNVPVYWRHRANVLYSRHVHGVEL